MKKKSFAGLLVDAKDKAEAAGAKIKHAAAVTGEQFSETTGKLVDGAKNTFDKLAKKAPAEEPTKELTQQEADPKVKLDDALRQAVTEYNNSPAEPRNSLDRQTA